MEFFKELFEKETTKKILVLLLIFLFFYLTRSMFNLFLLTFLLTFLINSLHSFVVRQLQRFFKVNQLVVTIVIYCMLFTLLGFMIYKYIPLAGKQGLKLLDEISKIDLNDDSTPTSRYISAIFGNIDINKYITEGSNYLMTLAKNVSQWGLYIFISIILSLFFMIEKGKNKEFVRKFNSGKLSGLYKYLSYYAKNFLNSFGKVIQAQVLIAMTNSLLSVVFLWILGFPQLLALGFMIFILSLIPVAGVIISLVPLCLIAFNIGGIVKVVWVLVMIAVLHGLESYVLNPKFMSAKTKLPVFFVFMILLTGENIMGFWGLLLGIPLFMFAMDLFEVKMRE